MPELPDDRRARFVREHKLPLYDAAVLTETRGLADYFEAVAARVRATPKAASNWVMGEVLRLLKAHDATIAAVGVPAEALGALIRLVDAGTISTTVAKGVFEQMYGTGRPAADIVAEQGLAQVSDDGALSRLVTQVLDAHAGCGGAVSRRQEGDLRLPGRRGHEGLGRQGRSEAALSSCCGRARRLIPCNRGARRASADAQRCAALSGRSDP